MPFFYTDDPVRDAERYYAQKDKEQEKLPKCDYCHKTITDDGAYDLHGEVVCENCIDKHFHFSIDHFID